MLITKHTVETDANPAAIWEIWKDVANWKRWDHELEFSTITGPFQTGAEGTLKAKGGPKVKLIFSEVKDKELFTCIANLPLCQMTVSHYLIQKMDRTFVTHQIELKGPLSFFFSIILGRKIKKTLPLDMKTLIELAEEVSD